MPAGPALAGPDRVRDQQVDARRASSSSQKGASFLRTRSIYRSWMIPFMSTSEGRKRLEPRMGRGSWKFGAWGAAAMVVCSAEQLGDSGRMCGPGLSVWMS
jgi:hypothetical protein